MANLLTLLPHPCGPSIAESITVEWHRIGAGTLWLRYHAEVLSNDLELPEPQMSARRDGLWRSTCFELFLREPGDARYYEFNFSPSREWAAYAFTDTRAGQRDLYLPTAPEIQLDLSDTHLALETMLVLPVYLQGAGFDAGLSAVIVENSGLLSYWALGHADPRKPDFHHPDCFTALLPPPFDA